MPSKLGILRACAFVLPIFAAHAALAGELAQASIILYVDADAVGPTHDGSSWCNAYLHVQDALTNAAAFGEIVAEIRVAEGVYYPDRDANYPTGQRDRTATFQLLSGVALRGGYAGCGAPDPDNRDTALNKTILSGDLNTDDDPDADVDPWDNPTRAENSYHVVTGSDTDSTAFLDGFTITAGNSPNYGGGMINLQGSPTLVDCVFAANSADPLGGAMYNENSNPALAGCTFVANAAGSGGGMLNSSSSPWLTDCRFIGNRATDGGGMHNASSNPVLIDCTFKDNMASDDGGGIHNIHEGNPILIDCILAGNTAASGGAMYNENSNPALTSCIFIKNIAASGGGMYSKQSSPTLHGCTFSTNEADDNGGGMHNEESSPTLINCVFKQNIAQYGGGMFGMYPDSNMPTVTLTNCRFTGNSATFGGGMWYLSHASIHVKVDNCMFSGNFATYEGGGIYWDRHTPWTRLTLTHSTLSGNRAGRRGGGVFVHGGLLTMRNCILWGNSDSSGTTESAQVVSSTPDVSYCSIQGMTESLGGVGNIDDDPLFVPGPAGCYYLSQSAAVQAVDSPCVDAGSDTSANLGLDAMTTRVDEGVDTGVVDIGYHYPVSGQPLLFGDYDRDGKVELGDVAAFQNCFTGERSATLPPCCRVFDNEPDGDVDLYDHRLLWVAAMLPVCGNGVVEFGEECDDGNVWPGDGCDDNCRVEANNDDCSSPTSIGLGTISFSNAGATTDGPEVTAMACTLLGDMQVGSDIWYCFTSPCADDVIVSVCGATYDSKMAVYEGCGCPAEPSLACSDDDCGPGQGSRVQFTAQTGESYVIRVGGFDFAQGTGTLTIFCADDPEHGVSACGTGAGDCFAANGTPACEDVDCCVTTCRIDPFCCDTEWDDLCGLKADGICGDGFDACAPGAGDCADPIGNGSPGCEDVDCCQAICERDPFCCLTEWDDICAGDVPFVCTPLQVCADATGDCNTANGTPGCDVPSCCKAVCALDPDCCETWWHDGCAARTEFIAACQ